MKLPLLFYRKKLHPVEGADLTHDTLRTPCKRSQETSLLFATAWTNRISRPLASSQSEAYWLQATCQTPVSASKTGACCISKGRRTSKWNLQENQDTTACTRDILSCTKMGKCFNVYLIRMKTMETRKARDAHFGTHNPQCFLRTRRNAHFDVYIYHVPSMDRQKEVRVDVYLNTIICPESLKYLRCSLLCVPWRRPVPAAPLSVQP
jgi:hypothetical protein